MPTIGKPGNGETDEQRKRRETQEQAKLLAMRDTVAKLELVEVGEGFRFDPDELLEAAKGQGFTRLVILAENPDGTLWVSGSANAGETVILIELAKHKIIHGE